MVTDLCSLPPGWDQRAPKESWAVCTGESAFPHPPPIAFSVRLILGGQMFAQGRLPILIKPQGYLCQVTVDWANLGSRREGAALPNPNRGGQEEAVPAVWESGSVASCTQGPIPTEVSSLPAETGKHETPTANRAEQIRFWGPSLSRGPGCVHA